MFNFFDKLKNTVSKTAQALVGNVVDTVAEESEFSEFVLDDMEDTLISADLGVNYAAELVDKLRGQNKIKPSQVKEFLQNEFLKTLDEAGSCELNYKENELNIYFITGVNGAGKTTLIGKLADPNSEGAERIAIKNVSFDDLTLFDFEVGAVGTCECPFSFTDMECIDLI